MSVTVSKGNSPYKVSSGHTETGDVVVSGGTMWVLSGGSADTTTISSGGTMAIKSGGIADGTVVLGGGQQRRH